MRAVRGGQLTAAEAASIAKAEADRRRAMEMLTQSGRLAQSADPQNRRMAEQMRAEALKLMEQSAEPLPTGPLSREPTRVTTIRPAAAPMGASVAPSAPQISARQQQPRTTTQQARRQRQPAAVERPRPTNPIRPATTADETSLLAPFRSGGRALLAAIILSEALGPPVGLRGPKPR